MYGCSYPQALLLVLVVMLNSIIHRTPSQQTYLSAASELHPFSARLLVDIFRCKVAQARIV